MIQQQLLQRLAERGIGLVMAQRLATGGWIEHGTIDRTADKARPGGQEITLLLGNEHMAHIDGHISVFLE